MKPEDLREALGTRPVPEHRPGFWDDLTEQLHDVSSTRPERSGWMVAVAAAVSVIAVVGVAALLARQTPPDSVPVVTEPPPIETPATTETPGEEDTPVAPVTERAPWDRDLLAIDEVSPTLVTEWRRAENQLWCSALFPAGGPDPTATIRRAEFGGGWAVAWDLPDLRSAFGVAGVGSPAWDDIGVRMPATVTYGDQVVGYGGEGFDEAAVNRLAEFSVPGQLCAYQVWSQLGDEHLLALVDSLRLVEGLQAAPIGDGGTPVEFGPSQRGSAPWAAQTVSYPTDWPARADGLPSFVFTSGVPAGSAVRTTTQPEWSLAWDSDSGPGHDSLNYPCTSCGRGVVGITVAPIAAIPDGPPDVTWDDGSSGFLLPRVGDPEVPLGRQLFRAPGSDELVPGAPRIDIYIPDRSVVVSIWSHLGLGSLSELVDGLRIAEPVG